MSDEQIAAELQKNRDRAQKRREAGTEYTPAGDRQPCPNPSCAFICSRSAYKKVMQRHLLVTPACLEWVKKNGTPQVRSYLPEEEDDQAAGAGGQEVEP